MMKRMLQICITPVLCLGLGLVSFNATAKLNKQPVSLQKEYTQYAYRGRAAVNRATPRVTATPRLDNVGPVVDKTPRVEARPVARSTSVTKNTIYINNTTYNLYRPGARLVAGSRCYVVNYGYGKVVNGSCLYNNTAYTVFYIP